MWPSDIALKQYLKHGKRKGTLLCPHNVDNASMILGKPIPVNRGKTQH